MNIESPRSKHHLCGFGTDNSLDTTTTGVVVEVLLSSTESSLVKSLVFEVVDNLGSDDFINTGELLKEDLDNFLNNEDIISESITLDHIPGTVSFTVSNHLFEGGNTVVPGLFTLLLIRESKDKIVLKLGKIDGASFFLSLELESFLFGLLDIPNGVTSGTDLVLDEVLHGVVKMLFENIKSFHDSVNNGNLGSFINTSIVGLDGKCSLVVVFMSSTDFLSSGNTGLVKIVKISIVGEGEEGLKGVLLEEVGEGGESVETLKFLDLGKGGHSSGFP